MFVFEMTNMDLDKLKFAADILKSIAHPLRIGIVQLLMNQTEMSVNDICEKLEAEQSLISHHLTNMRKNGVLSCRREGKSVLYTLELKELEQVVECVENCKKVIA